MKLKIENFVYEIYKFDLTNMAIDIRTKSINKLLIYRR